MNRRLTSCLALVGSLTLLVLGGELAANTTATTVSAPSPSPTVTDSTAATTTSTTAVPPPGTPAMTTTSVPGDFPVTGSGSRVVVRIGSLFFALGGIISYIASGSRRRS